jgi:hypothetical protein
LLHLGLFEARYNAAGLLERKPTDLVALYRQLQAEAMPALVEP